MKCTIGECDKLADCHGRCQKHNWRMRHYGNTDDRYVVVECSVSECKKVGNKRGMCELHYQRLRKTGTTDPSPPSTLAPKRYKQVRAPGHPLACRRTHAVYLHRLVLYTSIGPGPMPCFWCGNPLYWKSTLFVDHLDHNRHNNDLTNLVPACVSCNSARNFLHRKSFVSMYSTGKY